MTITNPYNIGGGVIGQPSAAPASTPGLIGGAGATAAKQTWLPTAGLTQGDWFKLYNSTTNYGTNSPKGGVSTISNLGTGTKRSGGGGGGGGAAAAPTLNQGQLDWYASLLKGAAPGQEQYSQLNLPQWNNVNISPFDSSMYDNLRGQLGTAVASDKATASGEYDNLTNYLQQNYSNPYDNATYATSQNVPGQTQQAMQRMLSAQGQNPQMANDTYRQGQSADQGFGNLLAILGSNENTAQRNRLSAVQADRGTTNTALDMAQLQGQTGIGLQQGQAQQAWQQRADDRQLTNAQAQAQIAQQQALANWQRQNEVGDANTTNANTYHQSVLSALTSLLPQLISQGGSLSLPTLQALGLA